MDVNEAVERLFAPARRPGRVGAEVELIPVSDTVRPGAVDPVVLAAGFDAGFVRAAAPSFEPGGQLELSPAPRPTTGALVRDLAWMLRRSAAIAAARGVRLEAAGLNPYHSCADVPLRLRTPRYLAMQQVFDETGPDGRRMMRLTASLQVTIDLLPGRAGREQWLVANLAGPPLAAAFANSGTADLAERRPAPERIRRAAPRPARPGRRVRGVRGGGPPAPHPGGRAPVVSPVDAVPAGPAAWRLSRGALPRRAAAAAHRRGGCDRGRAPVRRPGPA